MTQYILPPTGRFYRANLHSHSTDSDGALTPEQLVEGYRAHGYSILCISDHGKLIDRSGLCREDFLVLNGYEFNHASDPMHGRSIHVGLIARSPEIREMPELETFPTCVPGTADAAFTAAVNETVRRARAAGFLPIYNHMRWSLEQEGDLLGYDGFWGMEIFNYFSEILGIEEYNLSAFLAKLRKGDRLWAVMADDNHNRGAFPFLGITDLDPWDCSFGGYIEVKADQLRYESVIAALEAGHFYASMGPQFEALYIEDGVLHVKCSPVRSIGVATMCRRGFSHWSKERTFTEASFALRGDEGFVVVTLTDERGKKAVSQPFWLS